MACVEKRRLKAVALGLGLALLFANAGCSGGDDPLPALSEAPDAGGPDARPVFDAGSRSDGAASDAAASDALPADAIPPSPTANAGADQAVAAGVQVTLSGQGQDATGASLGYRWTQISGPTITLGAPDQAVTTFSAPLASGELEFQLAVQSANGLGSDRVKVTVSATPALFVANRNGDSVSRFAITSELRGNVAPEATWRGSHTRMLTPGALIVDKAGGLVVSTGPTGRILGYSSAFGAGGDVTPERYVGGPSMGLGSLEAMAYDRANDLLVLINFNAPSVLFVFGDVSTRDFTGAVKAKTVLPTSALSKPRDIEIAASGELYVVNADYQNIVVYPKPSAIDNLSVPSRTITGAGFTLGMSDAFIDASDRLYVVTSDASKILIFDRASTLTDAVTPTRTITVTTAPVFATGFNGITVDAAGTAYVTDVNQDAFYVIENAASRSGTVTPERTVTGTATGLSGPAHLIAVTR